MNSKVIFPISQKEGRKKRNESIHFSALTLVNDAQGALSWRDCGPDHVSPDATLTCCTGVIDVAGFAERLLSRVRQSNDAFSVRLMMMDVISRLISAHQLLVLDFYSFMQKYLQPQQLGTCALPM